MITIGHLKDLEKYKDEIKRIFGSIIYIDSCHQLEVLDANYGENRNIFIDDGGYLAFLKDRNDWKEFNSDKYGMLERNNYELFYTFFDDSENFVRVDYVVNNETMISVYMPQELFKE